MKKQLVTFLTLLFLSFSFFTYAQIDVVWSEAIGVTINGNSLTSATAGWGGAASKNKLLSGQDGWAEMTIGENTTTKYFGLSSYNEDILY